MRADKPNRGPLIAVLLLLAALQIGAGTFAMLKYREYLTSPGNSVKVEEEKKQEEAEAEEPDHDENFDQDDEDDPDAEEFDADADDDADDADPDDDEDDPEDDDEDADDDADDEDEDEEKDYTVMVVSAPDNYAAVRSGRGTQYQEVGRITNGHRVALKNLENGWYEIAKGKYKGYYTHQSSFVTE